MSYFKAEMNHIRLRSRVQTLLGRLTAVPQTSYLDFRRSTSKTRGRKGEVIGKEGRRKEEREGTILPPF